MLRALLTAAALLAFAAAPPANAAIVQVDTNTDVVIPNPADCTDADSGTPCSIRDALGVAGTTAEDDRILLPAGHYVLTNNSLQVTGPGAVTIVGAGAATTTLDGNDVSGVFLIDIGTTIEGVTIRDGHAPIRGGGIYAGNGALVLRDSLMESNEAGTGAGESGVGGALALGAAASARIERSVIRDNKAGSAGGGIWTAAGSGALTLVDSTVTANRAGPATGGPAAGGGIFADEDLTLIRVALADNAAVAIATSDDTANGGGAVALDQLTVVDSTISGNDATGTSGAEARGGGLYLSGTQQQQRISGTTLAGNAVSATAGVGEGGAIRHFAGTLTITNSTLSDNTVAATAFATQARGGGAVIDQAATLTNVTVAGNTATGNSPSGGNLVTPAAALRNTLVAGGTPTNCSFTVASAVGSLETGTSCGLGAGNRSGVANPRLGPLAANGGPTRTHALLSGSPAIDAGTRAGAPTTDQRGVRRPQRAGVDIGAYELVAPAPGGAPPPDRSAPTFATLDLTRHAFRARRGTTLLYALSEAATVRVRIERRTSGRRVNGRCVKRKRSSRTRPRCVRYVRTGARSIQATAGAHRLPLRPRRLKRGRYRLVVTAVDAAGNRSAPARLPFRVLAKR